MQPVVCRDASHAQGVDSVVWSLIQFLSFIGSRRGEFESLSPATMTVFYFLFSLLVPFTALFTLFISFVPKKNVSVFENTNQNHDRTGRPVVCPDKNHVRQQSRGVINVLDNVDLVPSHVRFSHQEAWLYVFEDNEAVIKMIIKGRSPTMRHVSRTHRVALDWLFDRINLNTTIQIKYIDTKNQLADTLTKGNFTRDEWNHLLCLFNISHFSSTDCSELMSKRTQKDSGEERVTANSKSMMNLVSRCSEKTPDVLASTASESPVKTRYESQLPLSSWNEQRQRTGRLVVDAYSSSYSEWNVDKTWSSQEWKSYELMEVRTGRPVYEQPPGLFTQHTDRFIVDDDHMDSDTVAESDMSFKIQIILAQGE